MIPEKREEKKKVKKLEASHERTISPNSNTSRNLLLWARREKNTHYNDMANLRAVSV